MRYIWGIGGVWVFGMGLWGNLDFGIGYLEGAVSSIFGR